MTSSGYRMVNDIDAVPHLAQSSAMNYRHAFHAGNHGDVLKHAILARVLTYMTAKDKPFIVLDAHAGIGRYDLSGVEAFKTGEWLDGIARLWALQQSDEISRLLEPYLQIINAMNTGGALQHYPGSPEIAARCLRPTDKMIFNELHAEDRNTLSSRYAADKRIRVTSLDALQAVKAHLPFAERRGVLLIDPAFEVPDETQNVRRMLQHALKRMASLIILIWYPVTTQTFADAIIDTVLEASNGVAALDARLMVKEQHEAGGLAGSGVVVINPPWTLSDELQVLLPVLADALGKGKWGKGSVL
jgi:23S rRNA (adenine2030-N6)-methyltransferase